MIIRTISCLDYITIRQYNQEKSGELRRGILETDIISFFIFRTDKRTKCQDVIIFRQEQDESGPDQNNH